MKKLYQPASFQWRQGSNPFKSDIAEEKELRGGKQVDFDYMMPPFMYNSMHPCLHVCCPYTEFQSVSKRRKL